MHMDTILSETQLPLRMVGVSHCFRREVGSTGQGLYRLHQFTKVELFMITRPEDSEAAHQELVDLECEIFDSLGLQYRCVRHGNYLFHLLTLLCCFLPRLLDMPVDDLGAPAYRKTDIEAFMPGRNSYGEISSASNCLDYQSRRLNIRYKPTATSDRPGSSRFVHTLNGTACAVPRMILTLLESNVNEDMTKVAIPAALQPFMGGRTHITLPPTN